MLPFALRKGLKELAGTTGLEPAASAVTGQRSNQLNYVPTCQIENPQPPVFMRPFVIRIRCIESPRLRKNSAIPVRTASNILTASPGTRKTCLCQRSLVEGSRVAARLWVPLLANLPFSRA
jgi:hypothetical protein